MGVGETIRDPSLLTRRGGGLQNGKIVGTKPFAPPSEDSVNCFIPQTTPKLVVPSLRGLSFPCPPPSSLAKTSVLNLPKTFCSPSPSPLLQHDNNIFHPALFVGVKARTHRPILRELQQNRQQNRPTIPNKSADYTTNSVIVGRLSLSNMFNILNTLE